MISHFWDSQAHLSNLSFWLEFAGCLIEVVVGIATVATFRKQWDEHIKEKLQFRIEICFLIAALIALVAIISNRRLDTLRTRQEKTDSDNVIAALEQAQTVRSNFMVFGWTVRLDMTIAMREHFPFGTPNPAPHEIQHEDALNDGRAYLQIETRADEKPEWIFDFLSDRVKVGKVWPVINVSADFRRQPNLNERFVNPKYFTLEDLVRAINNIDKVTLRLPITSADASANGTITLAVPSLPPKTFAFKGEFAPTMTRSVSIVTDN